MRRLMVFSHVETFHIHWVEWYEDEAEKQTFKIYIGMWGGESRGQHELFNEPNIILEFSAELIVYAKTNNKTKFISQQWRRQ